MSSRTVKIKKAGVVGGGREENIFPPILCVVSSLSCFLCHTKAFNFTHPICQTMLLFPELLETLFKKVFDYTNILEYFPLTVLNFGDWY